MIGMMICVGIIIIMIGVCAYQDTKISYEKREATQARVKDLDFEKYKQREFERNLTK